ncbi:uncharacterized protein LOC116307751 [Actinia tenebrosa]|uniref:Uncharacterized protein LOC116307751 n=1 Tax=Actinia tenebrosa TaxID=6105 RepID=A0A6P8J2S6_ACTTE|nr:uncharacterized protein LOC116307751 [Actinia tenebrosa]
MSLVKNIPKLSFLYYYLVGMVWSSVEGNDCRQVSFNLAQANRMLTNHVISNHTVENNHMCRIQCYVNPNCVSYHLGPSPTPGMMVCQLNDADRYQHPQDYQEKPGYFYGSWKQNMCQSSPCHVNATCQHGFTEKRYRCICPLELTGEHCEKEKFVLRIKVESRGKNNYAGSQRSAKLVVNGTDYNSYGRGHNLAAFRMNGEFISKASFDTHGKAQAGADMSTYINSLPDNSIVLVAVEDSGHNHVRDAHQALMSIGAKPPLEPNGLRASWCLIGHKGGYRPWIAQDQKNATDVIAQVSAKIYPDP